MHDKETVLAELQELMNTGGRAGTIAYHALTFISEQSGQAIPHLARDWWICECGTSITVHVDGEPLHRTRFCCGCGREIAWNA